MPAAGGQPFVTWALLAINILVWLAATAAGGTEDSEVLLDFGAMFGPLIAQGEYWRLLTAIFLHVGIAHLAFNGFALFIFGQLVERVYGHARFIIIYVVAGLAGSVASYLLNSIAVAAGASGAIFGILGAFAAYFVAQRDMLGAFGQRNLAAIAFLAGLNLVYGFITPGIDNWAHLGGLAGGFAVGLALAPRFRVATSPLGTPVGLVDVNSLAKRWWVVPVAVAVLVVAFLQANLTLPDNPYTRILEAERHLEEANYDAALAAVDEAITLDWTFAEGYFLRGVILTDLGDIAGARSEFGRAVQLGDRETRSEALARLLALEARR